MKLKRMLVLILVIAALLCGCQENTPDESTVSTECVHVDANGNTICDNCNKRVLVSFDLYAINDLHGKILDGDNHPGVDELTTYLKGVEKTDENAIFLSVGDMWQGAAESNMTKGILMTDWMNQLGFVAMTLGNHEFDWGETYIEDNAEFADFPLLAINIYDRETNALVEYCDPSVLIDLGTVQVGIIGAIGDCYSSIAPDKVEDVYFLTGEKLTQLVMEESQRLRSQGADFIVYSLHDGYGRSESGSTITGSKLASYYDSDLSNGYVDLVFEGHTHQRYLLQDQYGVYHLQNRGDNKGGIMHVEVQFNLASQECSVSQAELISTNEYQNLPDDVIVDQLVDKYEDQISSAFDVLGGNSKYLGSDDLRELVAMLYCEAGEEAWGDEYDITLGGGFISVRSPYELQKGTVTYADLQSLFPFDNDLVLCSISGRDLLKRFIHTSNYNYSVSFAQGVDMATINPNGTYYIVVDTYTSSYAPNNLTVVETYETGIYARDLLAEYIKNGGLA